MFIEESKIIIKRKTTMNYMELELLYGIRFLDDIVETDDNQN